MIEKVYKDSKKQAEFESALQKAHELVMSGVQITTKYCNRDEQIFDYANALGISRNMAAKVRAYQYRSYQYGIPICSGVAE